MLVPCGPVGPPAPVNLGVRLLFSESLGNSPEVGCCMYDCWMQVATGTVVNGRVIVEGAPLLEGATVAVLCKGADEPFMLSHDQEDELLAAINEIERGSFVTLESLIGTLRSKG
jgi:hypothetical protein